MCEETLLPAQGVEVPHRVVRRWVGLASFLGRSRLLISPGRMLVYTHASAVYGLLNERSFSYYQARWSKLEFVSEEALKKEEEKLHED